MKRPQKKLGLTRAEVESVVHYVWQHSRSSPDGKAHSVWLKMFQFLNDDPSDHNVFSLSKTQGDKTNVTP
jgi:hypothetical protein